MHITKNSLTNLGQNPRKRKQKKECNCRKGAESCRAGGKCNIEGVVCEAKIKAECYRGNDISYIESCATTFKLRHANHKATLYKENHEQKSFAQDCKRNIYKCILDVVG